MTLSEQGQSPDSLPGVHVAVDTFDILGVRPVLGRALGPDDDRPGAAAAVVIGHRLWTGRYDGNPGVIGRSVRINGIPATIVGVMPDGFEFPYRQALWQPLSLLPGLAAQPRDSRGLDVLGRVADGVTVAQAKAELATIAGRLAADYPSTNANVGSRAVPFGEQQAAHRADRHPDGARLAIRAARGQNGVQIRSCLIGRPDDDRAGSATRSGAGPATYAREREESDLTDPDRGSSPKRRRGMSSRMVVDKVGAPRFLTRHDQACTAGPTRSNRAAVRQSGRALRDA
jgi:hypothetical protein